jgi:hypothetical protein
MVRLKNPRTDKPANEADLINGAFEQIVGRLPRTWLANLTLEPQFGRMRPDGILELSAPDGQRASVIIEAKPTLNTRDVPSVWLQLRELTSEIPNAWPLVVARYLSPRTREMLQEQGLSYADATGNLRLELDRPAVFLEGVGTDADPWRGPDRELNSLRGRPATKVVRALLDFVPPLGIRQLADLSGASLGSTYRVVDFLEREAILTRDDASQIVEVDWRALTWRWSEDYDFMRMNRPFRYLEPRGLEVVQERLRGSASMYAITGSVAAAAIERYADPRAITVFVEDPKTTAEELELKQATSASNVILAAPYDPVAFARSTEREGLRYAAVSQVVVDLLSGPGRSPSEAEALIAWMARNEPIWRLPPPH